MISLLSQLAITLIWLWVGAKGFTIYYQKVFCELAYQNWLRWAGGNEMSNYDEAIKIVDKIYNKTDFTKEELQPLIDYLNKSETTEKELETLKKDVARYFELYFCLSDNDMFNYSFIQMSKLENETTIACEDRLKHEFDTLLQKLTKVGKEE